MITALAGKPKPMTFDVEPRAITAIMHSIVNNDNGAMISQESIDGILKGSCFPESTKVECLKLSLKGVFLQSKLGYLQNAKLLAQFAYIVAKDIGLEKAKEALPLKEMKEAIEEAMKAATGPYCRTIHSMEKQEPLEYASDAAIAWRLLTRVMNRLYPPDPNPLDTSFRQEEGG